MSHARQAPQSSAPENPFVGRTCRLAAWPHRGGAARLWGQRRYDIARIGLWGLWVLTAGGLVCGAEPAAWQRKLQAQQQTRAAAEALVAGLLEVQLRQLEENGLTGLPVYREIAEMKRHLTEIASESMEEIAALLAQLAETPAEAQPPLTQAVREKVRQVVAALMAQRQQIYRRLKVAHLAADVRQLLARQSKAQAATQALPAAPAIERPALALAVREDQADVHRWYYQLLALLEDVRGWGGPAAEGAARGLALLRVAQTEAALRAVAEALAQADFAAAAQGQQAVVDALTLLLAELEASQGLDAAGREAALALVRELAAQQQTLRQQTQQTLTAPPQAALLVDGQTALHRQLGQLALMLRRFPAATPLVQAAQEAALAAASELFQERPEPALAQQAHVVRHLAHLEQLLEAEVADSSGQSADALAAQVARLTALRKALTRLSEAWPAAADRISQVPALAEGLAAARPLAEPAPAPVATQFSQTEERVTAWQQLGAAAAPDALSIAADAAQRAFTQLQAEVTAALADTQRRQRAVAVGELARAAEALERAAATQREIARQLAVPSAASLPAGQLASAVAGPNDTSAATTLGPLAHEQQQVAAVTAKVAAGVEHTAPPAHRQLQPLAEALSALAERVAAVEGAAPDDPHRAAAAAEAQTRHAALVEAAALLRRAQGQAAHELQALARGQRKETEGVRQQVEQARPAEDASAGQMLTAWRAADEALRQAWVASARAAGRGPQAAAQRLQDDLAQVHRLQAAAQAAAEELAGGRSADPLTAAMAQQAVADQLAEMAAATSPLRPALQRAAQQAAQAARELLHGRHLAAQAARQELSAALAEADQALPSYAAQAQQAPAGPPDPQARNELVQQLERAAEALDGVGEGSGATERRQQAAAIARRLRAAAAAMKDADAASGAVPTLASAAEALAAAQSHVRSALQDAAQRQREALARQAAAAQAVQGVAAKADAGAATALAQAVALARRTTRSPTPPPALDASARVRAKWDEAVASLVAREGRLRRDEELAQLLASLALAQQAARDTIAQLSQQLEQPPPADQPPSAAAAQAAQRQELAGQLLHAEHQFAFAQTVTGQAATEVSGQVEVANVPLREALQLASALRLPQPASERPDGERSEAASEAPMGNPDGAAVPPASGSSGQPSRGAEAAAAKASQASSTAQSQPGPAAGTAPSSSGSPASSGQMPAQGAEPRALGTQLVPASPRVTARQIAGPQAEAAAQTAGMGDNGQSASSQGQARSGTGDASSPQGAASASARKGGAVQQGPMSPNQKPPGGELETAEAGQADSRGQRSAAGTEPGRLTSAGGADVWMARLPPELRAAIQARSRRLAPRGYEERLKRYFESVP